MNDHPQEDRAPRATPARVVEVGSSGPAPLPEPATERLPNEPERPSAQAASDLDLIALWLSEKAEHTRRAYEADLAEFVDHTDRPLQAVLLRDLQDYKAHLIDRGLAPSTVARKVACLKSLFTFAFKVGYVAFNVAQPVRQPTARKRLAEKLLSHGEVHALFAAVSTTQFALRNRALLRLFYAAGLRRSELAALEWRDVSAREDLSPPRGQVTVFGKGQKERTVLLTEAAWQALGRLRAEERAAGRGGSEDPVFWSRQGGPLSEAAIYRLVREAAKAAGIEAKPVSPHAFRHAHITHALQNGASLHVVMDTVGHASLETTSRYSHARPSESSSDFIQD